MELVDHICRTHISFPCSLPFLDKTDVFAADTEEITHLLLSGFKEHLPAEPGQEVILLCSVDCTSLPISPAAHAPINAFTPVPVGFAEISLSVEGKLSFTLHARNNVSICLHTKENSERNA